MSSKTFVAAALLAAAPSVIAGGLTIKNSCSSPVYYWIGQNGAQDDGPHEIAAGSSMPKQAYKGAAVVYKVGTSNVWGSEIAQMEYTSGSTLFYDLSNLNGYPFLDQGVAVTPAESSGCTAIACRPGVQECKNAYNPGYIVNGVIVQDETKPCDESTDLVMETCSGHNPGSGSVGSGSDSDSDSSESTPSKATEAPAVTSATHKKHAEATHHAQAQAQAAAPSSAENDPNVVVVTHWVTQHQQAQATQAPEGHALRVDNDGHVWIPREAAPHTTFVVEKRHAHHHGHAHNHHA